MSAPAGGVGLGTALGVPPVVAGGVLGPKRSACGTAALTRSVNRWTPTTMPAPSSTAATVPINTYSRTFLLTSPLRRPGFG